MNLIFFHLSEVWQGPTLPIVDLDKHDPRFVHIFEILSCAQGSSVKVAVVDGPRGEGVVEWLLAEASPDVPCIGSDNLLRIFARSGNDVESLPIDGHELLGGNINCLTAAEPNTGSEIGLQLDCSKDQSKCVAVIKRAGNYYGRKHSFNWQRAFRNLETEIHETDSCKVLVHGRFVRGLRLHLKFETTCDKLTPVVRADEAFMDVIELTKALEAESAARRTSLNHAVDIDLLLACPRPKVVDRLLQSCSTYGVRHVWIFQAQKTEMSYFHGKQLESGSISQALLDGLSQGACYSRIPKVTIHAKKGLKHLLEYSCGAHSQVGPTSDTVAGADDCTVATPSRTVRIVAHPEVAKLAPRVRDLLQSDSNEPASQGSVPSTRQPLPLQVQLAVGPEGGFTEEEVCLLEQYRFARVRLGPRILKTHDAVVNLFGLIYDSVE